MMGLDRKKNIAARVFRVGRGRIIFDTERLAEIKEAITKQDIRDLYASGAIRLAEIKGRMQKEKRTTRRGFGKVKKKVHDTKGDYIILVRKLRNYAFELRKHEQLTDEAFWDLRKKIKAGMFKSKAHLKEYLGGKR